MINAIHHDFGNRGETASSFRYGIRSSRTCYRALEAARLADNRLGTNSLSGLLAHYNDGNHQLYVIDMTRDTTVCRWRRIGWWIHLHLGRLPMGWTDRKIWHAAMKTLSAISSSWRVKGRFLWLVSDTA